MSWLPGDDIPGWEDTTCPTVADVNRFQVVYPSLARMVGTIDATRGVPDVNRFSIATRDCENFTCSAGEELDLRIPYFRGTFQTVAEDGEARGLGAYGPDADGIRPVEGSALLIVGPVSNTAQDGDEANAIVSACISRSRPDEVSGVLYFWLEKQGDPFVNYQYGFSEFWTPFHFSLVDHAGVLLDADPGDGLVRGLEATLQSFHWTYIGVSYDEAWPWAEITDPAVREAVYERYQPVDLRRPAR